MNKMLTLIMWLAFAFVFFSCQTAKNSNVAEERPHAILEEDAMANTIEQTAASESTDLALSVKEKSDLEQDLEQEQNLEEEFIPVIGQDIQVSTSTSDEFLPATQESMVIDLTKKKEDENSKTIKPVLRPRITSDKIVTAKIWNADNNAVEKSQDTPNVVDNSEDESSIVKEENVKDEKPLIEPKKTTELEVSQKQEFQEEYSQILPIQTSQTQQTQLQNAQAQSQPSNLAKNEVVKTPQINKDAENKIVQNSTKLPIQKNEEEQDLIPSKTSETTPEEEKKVQILPSVSDFIPSRSVNVKNNQYIDVTYPGGGWVYIGEEGDKSLLSYFGRKTDKENTVFTLRTKESGKTLLHFYKLDALSGSYIDDYLEVVIGEQVASQQERFEVPSYEMSSALKAPLVQREETTSHALPTQDASWISPVLTEPDVELLYSEEEDTRLYEDISVSQLLIHAKEAYNNSEYGKALTMLDEFLKRATENLDEAWYLKGQIYETPSAQRNIRKALTSYETLIKAYPSSTLWKQARDRITYLEKFYFTIN